MKKFLFSLVVASLALGGCSSSQKISTPSGKWVVINPMGYVPPNTPIYIKKSDTIEAVDSSLSQSVSINTTKGL